MTNLSIRRLDAKALAALKARAEQENASVNSLVVALIREGLGHTRVERAPRRHDDLDALAGSWKADDGKAFEHATALFGKVEAKLWK